jgi:transcriptional regulator with XRE-family HTH domain
MANHSRWEDIKAKRPAASDQERSAVEESFAIAQIIYDMRTEAGLSQRELAQRMGTTQSVISRLEEGGGTGNRVDTLARVATALGRHLVISFPHTVPAKIKDGIQFA